MKLFNLKKYLFVFIPLILILTEAQVQGGAWEKKTNIPVGPGSACVVDNKIYVIGGSTASSLSDLADNVVYDPSTDTWEVKAPMPTPRGFLSVAAVDGIIYAIGGGYPVSTKTVEAYNPATNSWTKKADLPENRLGARAAVVNGIIYNIGGNYSSPNCEAYNPVTDVWTKKTDMPEGGGVVSVTVYNGLIYVFGGGFYTSYNYVYIYNPQNDTWTKKSDMPTSRFAFKTFLVDGKIYAMGGAQSSNIPSIAKVEVYDPATDTWETKSNMPGKLAWLTGDVVNGKVYVTSGTSDWGVTVNKIVWQYDPAFHTDIQAGNVKGTWTLANSPFNILGTINVPNNDTLSIEPGVEVIFMGYHKLNVKGRLLAVGTKQDPILFTALNKTSGWHGIRFINNSSSNDSSKLVFCSFKYGKANTGPYSSWDRCGGAIFIRGFNKVLVSNSLFEYNMTSGNEMLTGGQAICIFNASPIIINNSFKNNYSSNAGGIIKVDSASHALISNNTISNNTCLFGSVICAYGSGNKPTISNNIISYNTARDASGILIYHGSNAVIKNNIIVHNNSNGCGAIVCATNTYPVLLNNTIAYNTGGIGGGLYCDSNSSPIFINTIIYGNKANTGSQVFINDTSSDPVFTHCDIEGGASLFKGLGAGVNYNIAYNNNIDADPRFSSLKKENYSLSDNSPCIGTGIYSAKVGDIYYSAPSRCIMGNPRPSPAGTNPDIGACESLLGQIPSVVEEMITPTKFALYQNYPNPFNPSTVISYQLPAAGFVSLKIYDVLGNEVAALVNEEKPVGKFTVTWNAKGYSSGVYFYQLKTKHYIETKKMLMMK